MDVYRNGRVTRFLLCAGILAGPVYVAVGLGQALTRPGFDIRRHSLSLLGNGNLGWIQVANFLVSGTLVILGAIGVRRTIRGEAGGTWGPIFLAVFGLGLVGAGIFIADPGQGFPPGSGTEPTELTGHGLLHYLCGATGLLALVAACLAFARRYLTRRRWDWAAYSALSAVLFLGAFVNVRPAPNASSVMLYFHAATVWIWLWHTAVLAQLLYTSRKGNYLFEATRSTIANYSSTPILFLFFCPPHTPNSEVTCSSRN